MPLPPHIRIDTYETWIACDNCSKRIAWKVKQGITLIAWKQMLKEFKVRHNGCKPKKRD